jgi:diadenosine tetraphosphatase ApaH/serine/threonine PP2A family protein phosphatase
LRIGVVADIHSNLTALQAVLEDMGPLDRLWCLGDFVGYGPWPNECIGLLRERDVRAIAGNHDLAAIGAISTADFNPDAAMAADWTAKQLSSDSLRFLESLEPQREIDGVTLSHGSPRDPIWEYVLSGETAAAGLQRCATKLCLVGHTHIPSLFEQRSPTETGAEYQDAGSSHAIRRRAIANPGSVGQPRDRDPRAAYLLFDMDAATLEWRRVPYDVGQVQARMREVRLPQFFIDRLEHGV